MPRSLPAPRVRRPWANRSPLRCRRRLQPTVPPLITLWCYHTVASFGICFVGSYLLLSDWVAELTVTYVPGETAQVVVLVFLCRTLTLTLALTLTVTVTVTVTLTLTLTRPSTRGGARGRGRGWA